MAKATGKLSEGTSDYIEIKPFKSVVVEIIPGTAFTEAQAKQDLLALK